MDTRKAATLSISPVVANPVLHPDGALTHDDRYSPSPCRPRPLGGTNHRPDPRRNCSGQGRGSHVEIAHGAAAH
jgi:hypothetical protein